MVAAIPETKVARSSQSSLVNVTASLSSSCPNPKNPPKSMPPPGPPDVPPPEPPPGPPPILVTVTLPPPPGISKLKPPLSLLSQEISIAPAFRFLNCSATSSFPPVPIASTSIMVADPTTIPMEVRITLNLFCDRFSHTRRNISDNLIFYFFPSIDLTFPQVSALLRNAAFDQYGISFCNISGDLHVRTI